MSITRSRLPARVKAKHQSQAQAPADLESPLQDNIQRLARLFGWLFYHTHDSRRNTAGFPDLALMRSPRVVMAELKSTRGQPTAEQCEWLEEMRPTATQSVEAYLWRPADMPCIERILGATWRACIDKSGTCPLRDGQSRCPWTVKRVE